MNQTKEKKNIVVPVLVIILIILLALSVIALLLKNTAYINSIDARLYEFEVEYKAASEILFQEFEKVNTEVYFLRGLIEGGYAPYDTEDAKQAGDGAGTPPANTAEAPVSDSGPGSDDVRTAPPESLQPEVPADTTPSPDYGTGALPKPDSDTGGEQAAESLVGYWQGNENAEQMCEFFKSGTIHFTAPNGEYYGTWEEDNGRIIIAANANTGGNAYNDIWSYEISGSTLTITKSNNVTYTYYRA